MDNISHVAQISQPKSTGWKGYAFVIIAILALGIIIGGWFGAQYGAAALGLADSPSAQAAQKPAPQKNIATNVGVGNIAVTDATVSSPPMPLQSVNPSTGDVSSELAAAKIQAARAESMLIAVAARRALDRGLSLGYIEKLLVQRFGESQAYAVKTIVAVSQKPVTLENLRMRLEALKPTLLGQGKPDDGFWASLNAEINQLVVVGDGSKPGQSPQDRMARAFRLLDSERIDAAIIEVEALSGKTMAPRWLDDARRNNEARRALDVIETAALVEQPLSID